MSGGCDDATGVLALRMSGVSERKCRLCGALLPTQATFCSRCGGSADRLGADEDAALANEVRALFAGEIAIDREIGRGSMAVVYLGFDLELERRVAIKVLLPDIAGDPDIGDRFKREAKLVAALNHPNVIPIHGVRNSPTLSAIIMQFVDGNSLDVVLRERGSSTLPLSVAGLVLSQVAAGLDHAHTRGVIHRDVKPANVLFDPVGRAVVSDFGIARRDGVTSVTGSGVLLGTAAYMSPEQCLGRRAAAASDQYAFGVMAFEVLAGRRPFIGRTTDVIRAHVNDSPPRLSELRPDLPPGIESFVMRMLEKDPAVRHPSLRDAERFFRRFVLDESSTTTQLKQVSLRKPIETPRSGATIIMQAPAVEIGNEQPRRNGRRTLGLSVAGVGLALLVAGALLFRTSKLSEKTTARPDSEVVLQSGGATTRSTGLPAESSTDKTQTVEHRAVSRSTTAAQPPQLQSAATEPALKAATDIAAGTDTALAVIRAQGDSQSKPVGTLPAMTPAVAATVADARAVAREFLTWCNHRQWQDVERLSSLEGSADMRSRLIDVIRKAPDFQAGFERVASQPVLSDHAFTTDFILDLEWRGGQQQLEVTVSAELSNGAWRLAGFAVRRPD